MPLHTWQRQHGPDILSQVESVEQMGTWRPSVWLVKDPAVVVSAPAGLTQLQAAQARADALARKTFNHRCNMDTCGVWLQLPSAQG
jgi:hypothetical protein